MSDIGLGLTYKLPVSRFVVTSVQRDTVTTTAIGSFIKPVADVTLVPRTIADPDHAITLQIDAGILEKIDLTVTLDDRGFITAINSEASRDITPILNIAGKAIGLAGAIVGSFLVEDDVRESAKSLEDQWAHDNARLSAHMATLETNIGRMLDGMGDPQAEAAQIITYGLALKDLQGQLATLSQVKRGWIADHAKETGRGRWEFDTSDLVRIATPTLPTELHDPEVPAAMQTLVDTFGVLVGIADPARGKEDQTRADTLTDEIALRRCRAVTVGTYLRDGIGPWRLDKTSATPMDVVDRYSPIDLVPLDGSWLRSKKFNIAYHTDMSVMTFGVATAPNASAIATSVGDLMAAAGTAAKTIADRPTGEQDKLDAAKTQLELLKTASEYEVLSATRTQAAEVAVLEQQKALRDATK